MAEKRVDNDEGLEQLAGEKREPFAQLAQKVGPRRGGKPTHPATLWRWAEYGLRGIKLEYTMMGGVRCTSRQALERFFAALTRENQKRRGGEPATTAAVSKRRERELERVDRELAALGLEA